MRLSQALNILMKAFDHFRGASKWFVKKSDTPLKVCLISKTSVHNLWHICIYIDESESLTCNQSKNQNQLHIFFVEHFFTGRKLAQRAKARPVIEILWCSRMHLSNSFQCQYIRIMLNTRKVNQYFSLDIVYLNGPTFKNGKMKSLTF